jgi:hypothetical protein
MRDRGGRGGRPAAERRALIEALRVQPELARACLVQRNRL